MINMKKIVEQIEKITYKGKCPQCNYEQISNSKKGVDKICKLCQLSNQKEKILNLIKNMVVYDIEIVGAWNTIYLKNPTTNEEIKIIIEGCFGDECFPELTYEKLIN